MAEQSWLVVGLGNPGPKYAGNRHNVGAMVLDVLADRLGASFRSHRSRAWVCRGRSDGVGGSEALVVLAKPSSYMNESGGQVAALLRQDGAAVERLIVVHDDLDLPFETVRLKQGGGEGGHNGLRSVSRSLRTRDYLRVRVGVGRPPGRQDPADFVLRDFAAAERAQLPLVLDTAADAVQTLLRDGLGQAQLKYHTST